MEKKRVVVISLAIIFLSLLLFSVFLFPDIWDKIIKEKADRYGNITSNATFNVSSGQETSSTEEGDDGGGDGGDVSGGSNVSNESVEGNVSSESGVGNVSNNVSGGSNVSNEVREQLPIDNETANMSAPSIMDNETTIIPDTARNYSCEGCELEGECYPVGYRKSEQYCSSNYEFVNQLESDSSCENNFECKSNICAGGNCIGQGMVQTIVGWFKELFGGA